MQDCLGEEQNDRIEMKEKEKLSKARAQGRAMRGKEGEKIVIMKTSA